MCVYATRSQFEQTFHELFVSFLFLAKNTIPYPQICRKSLPMYAMSLIRLLFGNKFKQMLFGHKECVLLWINVLVLLRQTENKCLHNSN